MILKFIFSYLILSSLTTINDSFFCGEVYVDHCASYLGAEDDSECKTFIYFSDNETFPLPEYLQEYNYIVQKRFKTDVKPTCRMSLCEGHNNSGNCLQIPPIYTIPYFNEFFPDIPNSIVCSCAPTGRNISWNGDTHFDRNYLGVEFNPYEKYYENISIKEQMTDYTDQEARISLKNVASKFTLILLGGSLMHELSMSSAQRLLKIAGAINQEQGFPAIRIILRRKISALMLREELLELLDAAENANNIYSGTVWAITIVDFYDEIVVYKQRIMDEIQFLRNTTLNLKIGIEVLISNINSTSAVLSNVMRAVDFVICGTGAYQDPAHNQFIPTSLKLLDEKRMIDVKKLVNEIDPKVEVMFLTGVPSGGVGNGVNNSIPRFRDYWYLMGNLSVNLKTTVFMFEAIDKPSLDVLHKTLTFYSHFGWWQRVNNSVPQAYIEKVANYVEEITPITASESTQSFWSSVPITAKILISVFLGLMMVTFGTTFYFWRKFERGKKNKLSIDEVKDFQNGGEDDEVQNDGYAVALRMPYNTKYELPEGNFFIDKNAKLGSGQSGVVYRGKITNISEQVAFKCTTFSSSVTDVKQLLSEIKILSYFGKHDYVVSILGAYTKKLQNGIIYVALEYCPLGSLESFLHKINPKQLFEKKTQKGEVSHGASSGLNPQYVTTNLESNIPSGREGGQGNQAYIQSENIDPAVESVTLETFILWSYQIASAMEFVSSKKIVHADLAARNVLLANTGNIKISDFGLSKNLYQDITTSHHGDYTPLPWRWMSPESLSDLVFSVETDVWSFGVTIWEIFSLAEVPYQGFYYNLEFVEGLKQGLRLSYPKFGSDTIHKELLRCWNTTPSERPSFKDLKQVFHSLVLEFCPDEQTQL